MSVLKLKVSLSFFIVPKTVSRKHVIQVALYFLHSWKEAKESAALDILNALEEYFLESLLC